MTKYFNPTVELHLHDSSHAEPRNELPDSPGLPLVTFTQSKSESALDPAAARPPSRACVLTSLLGKSEDTVMTCCRPALQSLPTASLSPADLYTRIATDCSGWRTCSPRDAPPTTRGRTKKKKANTITFYFL